MFVQSERERNQPRQQARAAFGGPVDDMQRADEEQQSKKMGPCEPMN